MNLNLKKGLIATNWCLDYIVPIYKEGSLQDPGNYRGICIMNALIKLLCNILNNRLREFCHVNKLINKSQISFQKQTRTAAHIFTLKTIVNKYVTEKKGKKLYTCFIDFKKTFDSVWHEGLFRKLENKGINGNFMELIKNIYKKTKYAVKLNEKLTNFFPYSKGVQQGNPIQSIY